MTNIPRKVLFVSSVPTHPPIHGNRRRVLNLVGAVEQLGYEAHFFALPFRGFLNGADVEGMRDRLGGRFHVAERKPVDLLNRLRHLVHSRLERWSVGHKGVNTPSGFVPDVDDGYSPLWNQELRALHKKFRFAAVVVEYVFTSRALLACPKGVLRLIDTIDVFEKRNERMGDSGVSSSWFQTTAEREDAALRRAHVVVAIQDHERDEFAVRTTRPVITVGHMVDQPPGPLLDPDGPPSVLLVSSGNPVNLQGLVFFLSDVWPSVCRAIPGAVLRVAGRLADVVPRCCRSVEAMGIVQDDLLLYSSGHVVVNPVLAGTGLSIKTIEALGFGKPVVATPSGARGLGSLTDSVLVGEDPGSLARNVVTLLLDQNLRRSLGERGWRFSSDWNRRAKAGLTEALSFVPESALGKAH